MSFAINIEDIVDPARRGIGASVNQNTAIKATDTTKSSAKTNNLKRAVTSPLPAERLSEEIFGSDNKNYISTLVNEMLDATVNKKLRDEIKNGRLSLQRSGIYKTYSTAVAYYKKLYDGSFIMTELRNKTEKNISKLINQRINDKIFGWQKRLPEWQRMLLAKSKLMSTLTQTICKEVHGAISSIFTDKMISGINDVLIGNLKSIKNSIGNTINTQLKSQIEAAIKLRSAVQDKIVAFVKMKQEYEQKIANAISAFTKKISEALAAFTQKLVGTLTDSIKNLASGLSKGVAKA